MRFIKSHFYCFMLVSLCVLQVRPGYAQDTFYFHTGEPPMGTTTLFHHTVITADGIVVLSAQEYYEIALETSRRLGREDAEEIPQDLSGTSLRLDFQYMATSGDEMPYELQFPMPGPITYRPTLPKGHYRNQKWTFEWTKPDGTPGQVVTTSPAKLIIPNVMKIPVYIYADALNQPLFDRTNPNIAFEMALSRNRFRDLEKEVSRIATNGNANLPNNYGCSGWYQFKFMGYINGFDQGIEKAGDLNRLPPGITIVPSIDYCGGPSNADGCATLNGNRIAILANVFSDRRAEPMITLHEIGHTKGLDHDDSMPNHVMNSNTSRSSVGIKKEECRHFSVGKQYTAIELWR